MVRVTTPGPRRYVRGRGQRRAHVGGTTTPWPGVLFTCTIVPPMEPLWPRISENGPRPTPTPNLSFPLSRVLQGARTLTASPLSPPQICFLWVDWRPISRDRVAPSSTQGIPPLFSSFCWFNFLHFVLFVSRSICHLCLSAIQVDNGVCCSHS